MAVSEVGPSGHLLTEWNLADVLNPALALSNLGIPNDSGWTNVSSFSNSWSGVAAYILLGNFACLRGAITTSGAINTTAFTLPAKYRPSANWFVTTSANNAFAILFIKPDGSVVPFVGSITNFTLNCVFPVV